MKLRDGAAEIRLFPVDTKAKRAERWSVPDALLPYLSRYIEEIRPAFPGVVEHDAFWPSI